MTDLSEAAKKRLHVAREFAGKGYEVGRKLQRIEDLWGRFEYPYRPAPGDPGGSYLLADMFREIGRLRALVQSLRYAIEREPEDS